jgi:photosystem II stability/assembly factor-like uncharacterized protein
LIEERLVFEQFHQALDVEPRPGAFDRLQAALVQRPLTPQHGPALVVRLPRVSLRVVAGVLVVLLLVAVIAAFLAVHRPKVGSIPVGPGPSGSAQNQPLPQVMSGNVGWADGPLRTVDGGLTWHDASPPTPPNVTKGGRGNYFFDANHAWVTMVTGAGPKLPNGTTLVVFATADGGSTWTQSGVPINGVVNVTDRFDFIDAQRGWLIVDSGSYTFDKTSTSIVSQPIDRTVYATKDGGASWSRLAYGQEGDGSTLGTLGLSCSMSGPAFTDVDHGWLTWDCNVGIGPPRPPSASSLVAVTVDGGRTWQPVELPSFPSSTDYVCSAYAPVFTLSHGVLPIFCGGIGRPGFSGVYATNDGGISWTLRKVPFFTQQLDFVDANTGWTFGSTGVTLYRTTNGGTSWAVVKPFPSEQSLNGFKFLDSKTGFVLTSRYAPDNKSGFSTMWKTTDGGKSWVVLISISNGGRGF